MTRLGKKPFVKSIFSLGWVVSILVHIVVAAVFLAVSLGDSEVRVEREVPQGVFEESVEVLEPMPMVSELEMEPAAMEEMLPMAEEPMLPDGPIEGDYEESIGVLGGERGSGAGDAAVVGEGRGRYGSRFCGTGGSGSRVCYVVDCSGSMVMALDYVRGELKRSIGRLRPGHYFNVIFYAGGEPRELSEGRLLRANSGNRAKALEFVDSVGLANVGSSKEAWQAVVAAMEAAFAAKSVGGRQVEMIYLLTDGEYDHDKVFDGIGRLQAVRAQDAVVSVIACGSRENEGFLRRLAVANKGRYRFVSDEELARPIR